MLTKCEAHNKNVVTLRSTFKKCCITFSSLEFLTTYIHYNFQMFIVLMNFVEI